jgi:predicted  nucleic acid-binding Zn-ribbon protein
LRLSESLRKVKIFEDEKKTAVENSKKLQNTINGLKKEIEEKSNRIQELEKQAKNIENLMKNM